MPFYQLITIYGINADGKVSAGFQISKTEFVLI
jgi:hypothetical protein